MVELEFFVVGATARDIIFMHAYDLKLVLRNYADLGNEERIFEVEEILTQEHFDYEIAGAVLLGHDIATIAKDKTLMRIREILENETGEASQYRLFESMQNFNSIGDFKLDLKLLSKMKSALKIK
jgi:predicted nucleotidyltransferase